jgi:hypothetical protein
MNTKTASSNETQKNYQEILETVDAFVKHKVFTRVAKNEDIDLSSDIATQVAKHFETSLNYKYSEDFNSLECFQSIADLLKNDPDFIIENHPVILNFLYSSEIWITKSDEMALRNCQDRFSVSEEEIDDFLSILNAIIDNNKGAMFDKNYVSYDQLLKTKQKWKSLKWDTYKNEGTTEIQQFKDPIDLCIKFFSEKIQSV